MPVMKLSVKEYEDKVKGTPILEPVIDNEPVSDESIWEFIENGAKSISAAQPSIVIPKISNEPTGLLK